MKKRIALLILVILMLLSGCNGSSEQAEGASPTGGIGYDSQDKYRMITGIGFQEANGVYCGNNLGDHYLYYYDAVSGISGVLCSDPSCTHDSYTCSAYISTGCSVCYYDGKLYWVGTDRSYSNYCLWCSDLTGLNREKVKSISFEEVVLAYQPQQYTIHRGRLYFIGLNTNVESMESGYRVSLVSTSLDDSEEFTAIFDLTTNLPRTPTMRFSGNCAYFSWYRWDEDGAEVLIIEKYDTETGAYETLLEEVDSEDVSGKFWVTEEGTVYVSGADESQNYLWRVENGELAEVSSWASFDDTGNFPTIMDGIIWSSKRTDGIRYCAIRNFAGEILYEGMMFPEETPGIVGDPNEISYAIVGGDTEKIIISLKSDGSDLAYTLLLDLQDNLTATLLWGDELVINKG